MNWRVSSARTINWALEMVYGSLKSKTLRRCSFTETWFSAMSYLPLCRPARMPLHSVVTNSGLTASSAASSSPSSVSKPVSLPPCLKLNGG